MKKVGVIINILLIVVSLSLIASAATNTTNTTTTTIDGKAISCINGKVVSGNTDNCNSLTVEEQALVALTTGRCVAALTAKSSDGDCWPSGNCDLKQTALASMALSSTKGEKWLSSKNITPPDLNWYIQVDSDVETKCTIKYDGRTYNFKVLTDKRIDSNPGSCLTRARDNYWLQIGRSCANTNFEISCDKDFNSNLIYSKKGEEKYYISSDTKSGSENSQVQLAVNSACIADRGKCDYEGTLWTTLLLLKNKKPIETYLPYLIAFSEENQRFGSHAFLYQLTGFSEYYSSMQKFQKDAGYFDFGSPYKKYYDTGVALLALASSSSNELSKAKDWLADVQDNNGCWNSLRDTAFILYAGWSPRVVSPSNPSQPSQTCASKNFFCLSTSDCTVASGNVLDYTCPGVSVCCSKNIPLPSCSSRGGTICSSGQVCSGNVVPSSDSGSCCTSGQCVQQQTPTTSECESQYFTCRSQSCFSNEEQKAASCNLASEVCCGEKSSSQSISGGSNTWIWILVIAIVVIILLILLRHKLFGPKGSSVNKTRPGPAGFMPPLTPLRRPVMQQPAQRPAPLPQRPIQPRPATPAAQPKPAASERDRELDDTFKKLKDMGK